MRMKVFLPIATLLFTLNAAGAVESVESTELARIQKFQEFMETHGKSYATNDEYRKHLQIFSENLAIIDARNQEEIANGGSAVHGITKFSDIPQEEFVAHYLGYNFGYKGRASTATASYDRLKFWTAAQVKDWTGVLTTPVRDQGSCGSCWAFAAVEQVESDAARLFGWPITTSGLLSTQQVNSCDTVDGGCNGGNTDSAWNYIMSNGLQYELDYPYTSGSTGRTGTCKFDSSKKVMGVTKYSKVTTDTSASVIETAMANYVLNIGPLSICLDANSFNSYSSGILKTCGTSVNHCVQLVGVNLANVNAQGASDPYWILRNQWGTNWGMSGFIYLKYGVNLCRLTSETFYTTPFLLTNSPLPTPSPVKVPTMLPTPLPLAPTKIPTYCTESNLAWVGDGNCDTAGTYNTAACNWDGGDCCPQTCQNAYYTCGVSAYECMNPTFSAMPVMMPTIKPTTRFPTAKPSTQKPTAKPSQPTVRPLLPSSTKFPTRVPAPQTSRPTKLPSSCTARKTWYLGDGWCDDYSEYNTAACNWDGGDCCPQTCVSTTSNQCGDTAYSCRNPVYTPPPVPLPTPQPSVPVPTALPTTSNPTREPTLKGDCIVDDPTLLGDGYCDSTGGYNTPQCDFDHGDCCASTCTAGRTNPCGQAPYICLDRKATDVCPVAGSSLLGNGYCNPGVYNTPACGYDNGDCCSSSCGAGRTYSCGSNTHLSGGYECLDPNPVLSVAPTVKPSSAPVQKTRSPTLNTCSSYVNNAKRVGDGRCDSYGSYNSAACGYDGGDCCPSTCVSSTYTCSTSKSYCTDPKSVERQPTSKPTRIPTLSGCVVSHPDYIGDGYCDSSTNIADCKYDGGDCCQSTCVPSDYNCPSNHYNCKDPNAS